MSLEDIDRKIRLAKKRANELQDNTHMEFVIKGQARMFLDILGDIHEILERQDEAIRAMPQSS
jgi:hypothetical protein